MLLQGESTKKEGRDDELHGEGSAVFGAEQKRLRQSQRRRHGRPGRRRPGWLRAQQGGAGEEGRGRRRAQHHGRHLGHGGLLAQLRRSVPQQGAREGRRGHTPEDRRHPRGQPRLPAAASLRPRPCPAQPRAVRRPPEVPHEAQVLAARRRRERARRPPRQGRMGAYLLGRGVYLHRRRDQAHQGCPWQPRVLRRRRPRFQVPKPLRRLHRPLGHHVARRVDVHARCGGHRPAAERGHQRPPRHAQQRGRGHVRHEPGLVVRRQPRLPSAADEEGRREVRCGRSVLQRLLCARGRGVDSLSSLDRHGVVLGHRERHVGA